MSTTETLPVWKQVWRNGFCKILPTEALEALAKGCETDDSRLTQGSTTTPPPLMSVQDWPCEAGCALGYMGAMVNGGLADETLSGKCTNKGAATVGTVEELFARWCFDADQHLGEPAACRSFLNWFDDTPRPRMLAELLEEIKLELARRVEAEK